MSDEILTLPEVAQVAEKTVYTMAQKGELPAFKVGGQWHFRRTDLDPTYGTKLGEFFRDFVAGEAHSLGVAVGDLRTWTPPAAPKRTTIDPAEVLAALQSWKPEVEEDADDDGEETELPDGPTEVELASAVGFTKALVSKALKKLIADGLVEKLSGRPARYVATGDQA